MTTGVLVLGAGALAVAESPSGHSVPTASQPAPAAPAPAAALSQSERGSAQRADGDGSGGTVAETISVGVHAGSLFVRDGQIAVPLTWNAQRAVYEADTSIDVVDARGTLSGWTVDATVQLPDDVHGRLHVRPAKPTVIDGYDEGLVAGRPAEAKSGDDMTIGWAKPGEGGGAYRLPLTLTLSGVKSVGPSLTVTLVPRAGASS